MATEDIDPDWPAPAYQPSDVVDTTPPSAPRRIGWLVAALVAMLGVGAGAVYLFSGDDHPRPAAKPAPPTTQPAPMSPAANPPSGPCGPSAEAALAAALSRVPPDRKTGKPWARSAESTNYDPCAELSAMVVTVEGATTSSPDLALMFHRGAFVGTATSNAYPYTELEVPASTHDTVVLTYRAGQTCSTCTDGTLTTVGFQWKDGKVETPDPLPESVDSPP